MDGQTQVSANQELDLSDYRVFHVELNHLMGLFSKLLSVDLKEKYLSKALARFSLFMPQAGLGIKVSEEKRKKEITTQFTAV